MVEKEGTLSEERYNSRYYFIIKDVFSLHITILCLIFYGAVQFPHSKHTHITI